MRVRTKVIAGSLLLAAVAIGVAQHYRLKHAVEIYREELRARGEKLEPAVVLPPSSLAAANGGQKVLDLARALGGPFNAGGLPLFRSVPSGRLVAAAQEAELPTAQSSNAWVEISAALSQRGEALKELRQALAGSAIEFAPVFGPDGERIFPHLQPLREAAGWLQMATVFDLHERRLDDALASLLALIRLAQCEQTVPTLAAQGRRNDRVRMAFIASWEALQQAGWREEQLAALQAAWESLDFVGPLVPALEGERGELPALIESTRRTWLTEHHYDWQGRVRSLGQAVSRIWQDFSQIYGEAGQDLRVTLQVTFEDFCERFPNYWTWGWWGSYRTELVALKGCQIWVEAARRVRDGEPAVKSVGQGDVEEGRFRAAHPLTSGDIEMLADTGYFRLRLERASSLEVFRRLTVTASALKRFEARTGRLPSALADLCPNLLAAVPADPCDGQPLRYRPSADGAFLLYSVGLDGKDDGGNPADGLSEGMSSPRPDVPRDLVSPQRASAEETKVYFHKLASQRFDAPSAMTPGQRAAFEKRYGLVLETTNAPNPDPPR